MWATHAISNIFIELMLAVLLIKITKRPRYRDSDP